MMDKLISQQAAIDALCKSECGWNNAECRHKDDTDFCVTCDNVKIIKSLPSAQPKPEIGHWVEIGDEPYDEWECDVCGFVIDGSGCIDPEEYRDIYRFCPNCGADMRGDENGKS